MCTERLISLLSDSNHEFHVPGIKVCRRASSPNHLLFADDNVLFCKADVETNRKIQKLLKFYGLALHTTKTMMVFSKNTSPNTRDALLALWTNGSLKQYEKYLGLSPMIGKLKRKSFAKIKN